MSDTAFPQAAPDFERLKPYVEAGYDLMPLKALGKSPRDMNWRQRTYRPDEAAEWMSGGCNVGVRLGTEQLIIDVDPRNGGNESFANLQADLGVRLDIYPTVKTGGGGRHIYLSKPAELGIRKTHPNYPGIDFLTAGTLVVAPGSVHPESHRNYELDDPLGDLRSLPDAPAGLLRLLDRPESQPGDDAFLEPTELASILALIDVRAYSHSYQQWLEFSMACHAATAGAGEDEWLDWCAGDPDYTAKESENALKWSSFQSDHPDRVGVGTLRLHAGRFPAAAEKLRYILAVKDFPPFTDGELAELSKFDDGDPIDVIVKRMNERFCAVLEGGRFSIYMDETDDTFEPSRQVWRHVSREDFRHYHEDERIRLPDSDRNVSVADLWLRHPKRRKYSKIVMDPGNGNSVADALNLWQGWGVTPAPGDWSMMRNLIDEILCAGDEASAEYVRRWIAFMLQKPNVSPETAIAFRGAEGTGKGTLGQALMQIAGRHGLTVSSSAQFAGRFNSHLRDCVFLFADEALWPGYKDAESTLKQLVTEPVIAYEAKGRDIVSGRNHVHLMLASNEPWIVPAGMDARRFAVFAVSPMRQRDREFFGPLKEQLKAGGLAAMAYDLLNLDLGGWHPAAEIPQTAALAEQKLRSLPPAMRWWRQVLERGSLPTEFEVDDWKKGPVTLASAERQDLVDDYDEFLKKSRLYSERSSHKALLDAAKELGVEQTRIDRGSERAWVLPPLREMRAAFEGRLGASGLFD